MVVPCEENPLPVEEVEIDEFQFHYTASEKPHIQNVRSECRPGNYLPTNMCPGF